MEGGGALELRDDLVALRAVEVHGHELEACPVGRPRQVPAMARVREAEVLPAAIAGDPPWTLLLWRAVPILDADQALLPALHKAHLVQLLDQRLGHLARQLHVRLLERALRDVHAEAPTGTILAAVGGKEGAHVALEQLVRMVHVEEPHPEHVSGWHAHAAGAVRGDRPHPGLLLRAVAVPEAQCPLELGRPRWRGHSVGRLESHDEARQYLRRHGDDVVRLIRHPDVVPVAVRPRGRRDAKAQAAHKHELTAAAIALGHNGAIRKVLARAKDLAAPAPRIEATFADGQHIVWVRPVESLELVRLAAELRLEFLPPRVVLPAQQRVVDGPGLEHRAAPAAL